MLNIAIPENMKELKPKITIIGVGGAGGNAVNNMIESKLEGVEFVVANTDGQALANSLTSRKIQLGQSVTSGLGAGSRPDIGKAAAEESMEEIMSELDDSNMVFITAGLGGGTGTGAAPVIAQATRERGILTVCVVTKPFAFEGEHRKRVAENGLEEIQKHSDTLIVIPNQNLFKLANEKTGFAEAFNMADNVLRQGVCGVTDLMVKEGMINLDFADIKTVMGEMGKAMMGTGDASGENRSIDAANSAINNPLLDEMTLKGAKAVLINITGGKDMTLFEVDEAANHIRKEIDPNANIIFGSAFDDSLEGSMRVSVVATGIHEEVVNQTTKISEPTFKVDNTFYINQNNQPNDLKETNHQELLNENIEVKKDLFKDEKNKEDLENLSSKISSDNNLDELPDNNSKNKNIELNNSLNQSLFDSNSEVKFDTNNQKTVDLEIKENVIAEHQSKDDFFLQEPAKTEESKISEDILISEKVMDYTKLKDHKNDNLKNTGLIDRITGFWSQKDQNTILDKGENNNIKEPAFIEKKNSSDTKQTEMDVVNEEIDSTVLEIPAFLRRQAN